MVQSKKIQEDEQLELGKKLQAFYESGYVDRKQAILFSFYKGIAAGFGAFLGGTILIALLLWLLSFFNQVPLVNHFVHTLSQATKTTK